MFELTPEVEWLESAANALPSVDAVRPIITVWDDHSRHCPCQREEAVLTFFSYAKARSTATDLDWEIAEDLETFDDMHAADQVPRAAFR